MKLKHLEQDEQQWSAVFFSPAKLDKSTPEAWPHTSIEEVFNKYELSQDYLQSLPQDGIGPTSRNTEFLASGFQFSP